MQRPADDSPALPSFDPLLPPQMARRAEETGVAKANGNWINTLVLSVLAGAFIALGAEFFTMVTTASGAGYGLTRLIGGLAFSLGLFLVVVAGAELFTGNNLVVMAWASRRISSALVLRNWALVYAGNFAGALATVGLVYLSKQWEFSNSEVGANALRIADNKVDLGFTEAIALGILCNGLVCLAVWLSYSARSVTDKFLAVVNVIGQGFVREGQVILTAGDEVLTPKAPPTWQTHARWEMVVSRGDTEKTITSIKVVNPADNMQASGAEITKPADCKISAKR
jgi:formate/nitrite transporter